jgi:hypothetical protein
MKTIFDSNELKIVTGKNKRFKAIFKKGGLDGGTPPTVEFGQKNPKTGTYIDHSNEIKRENYLKRHEENPKEKKFLKNKVKYYQSPSVLSADILWGKSDNINTNIKNFKKKYL